MGGAAVEDAVLRAPRSGSWVGRGLLACALLLPLAAGLLTSGLGAEDQATGVTAPPPAVVASAEPSGAVLEGYVEDQLCAQCHRTIYEDFRTVGMSRAFYPPDAERQPEDFDNNHYYHGPSNRHYEMVQRPDGLFLHRYQLGPAGERRHERVEKVDWILGSGSNARTYIYQTEWGELFQMPISWYSRSGEWAMAPGYDRPDHQGFQRRVQRDCMFCHNAYPPVAADSERYGEPQIFPQDLPQGLGCQRCHGPGEAHVRLALDFEASEEEVQGAIVQPGRLDAKRRDDVCLQCHLQPTVTLSGVRHFDRPIFSYRPGEDLDDYLVFMDVVEERPAADRFEINHHPYRLRQSKCYLESPAGELSCLTCHDPHHKPSGEAAKVQFRDACLSCHTVDACQLEAMAESTPLAAQVAADDCVACHMPRRRAQDVIEVTVTDHLIRRRPVDGDELVAPIQDVEHRIRDVVFLHPETAPQGSEAEIYRQVARLRAGNKAALERLQRLLQQHPQDTATPYWELSVAELEAGQFVAAQKSLAKVLQHWPEHRTARVNLGLALAASGQLEAAEVELNKALDKVPNHPQAHFNLARIRVVQGRLDEAAEHFGKAIQGRPNLDSAWLELGNVRARQQRFAEAIRHYRRALELDPEAEGALHNMVEAHLRLGQVGEARAELEARIFVRPDDTQAQQRLKALALPETK